MTEKSDRKISKRMLGLQPLAVIIFIELLFSRLTDGATLIEQIKAYLHLSLINVKLIFTLCLIIPVILFWAVDKRDLFKKFIIIYVSIDTVRLIFAVFSIISSISNFRGISGGEELFEDVIFIWFINVIVFGVWYWILDAGGPYKRNDDLCERRDFLFPQIGNPLEGWKNWSPDFVDYLFLAFNTSTTFGPTDTMVLSRRVKILMMIQVVASLMSISVIAARAVTILK